ncbi:hypothetical protein E4U54_007181 [Claviceps lovelessii]|nr:hypothetical protein E4U54_007181 [Claviceps lovelessii]
MSSNPSALAPFRPLLSRTRDEEAASAESSETNPGRKRDVVVAACEDCRKRKAKTRGSALKRKHEYLDREFQELQKSHDALQQLVHALQCRDEKDALAILQRIRQHEDAETIMEHLHASDLLLELQTGPYSRSMTGGSTSTHQVHIAHMPHIPTSLLLSPNASSFPRLGQEGTKGVQVVPSQLLNRELRFSPISGVLSSISNVSDSYTKPHALVRVVDSRLDSIVPSRWTRVSADDDVLRDLLGRYFIQEYVRIACFHKDQFLEDMASGSIQFCSSLLYCHHETVDKEKSRQLRGLGYECLAEAKSLWDQEQEKPIRITTIQAAMVLSVTMNGCSAQGLGIKYARAAVAMAINQGLFLSPDAQHIHRRLQQAHEFTAWCLHNWIILQGYQFVMSTTPDSQRLPPLPDPETNPEWYGKIWMQDFSTKTRFCLDHARLFKARCEILSIINDVARHFSRPYVNAVSDSE